VGHACPGSKPSDHSHAHRNVRSDYADRCHTIVTHADGCLEQLSNTRAGYRHSDIGLSATDRYGDGLGRNSITWRSPLGDDVTGLFPDCVSDGSV
jgi:hypothetical protein